MPNDDLTGPNRVLYTVLVETDVSVANNPGLRRMIAGSVANIVGLNHGQLHLISVEKCADCRSLHVVYAALPGSNGKLTPI
jgi:hypothetical protein